VASLRQWPISGLLLQRSAWRCARSARAIAGAQSSQTRSAAPGPRVAARNRRPRKVRAPGARRRGASRTRSSTNARAATSAGQKATGLRRARIHRALGFTNLAKARARKAELRVEWLLAAQSNTVFEAQQGIPQSTKGFSNSKLDPVAYKWTESYRDGGLVEPMPVARVLKPGDDTAAYIEIVSAGNSDLGAGKSEPGVGGRRRRARAGTLRQLTKNNWLVGKNTMVGFIVEKAGDSEGLERECGWCGRSYVWRGVVARG
jgi:hypothetical protein